LIVIPTHKSFERIHNMELRYRPSSDFRLRVTQTGHSLRSIMHELSVFGRLMLPHSRVAGRLLKALPDNDQRITIVDYCQREKGEDVNDQKT
jgi:hypothetical protein